MYSILIVDDEPLITKGIRLIIDQSGLPVNKIIEAENGEEALNILKNFRPNIIITDIQMPIVDGLELCRRLYKKIPDTRLIILSGYDEFSYAKKAIQYNVQDYLLKPVIRKELVALLQRIFDSIEEKKNHKYMSHAKMEAIAEKFSQALWDEDEVLLFETTHNCGDLIFSDDISIINAYYMDLMVMIESRLSIKLGYSFKVKRNEFKARDAVSFKEFLSEEIKQLKIELDHRLKNTEYNLIEMSKTYIDENYANQFTLKDMALLSGFSESYFSQIFKKTIGKSFVQYRLDVRLSNAKEMLKRPNVTITEASFATGFNDLTYFSRKFKQKYGMSPQNFKREIKRK